MAKIGDFFHFMGQDESTVPLAYLLLMANVLGLAVYFDSKKKTKTCMQETLPQNLAVDKKDQTASQITIQSNSGDDKSAMVSQVPDNIDQSLDEMIDKVDEKKIQKDDSETNQWESTDKKSNKEQLNTRGNVIDFKELAAAKGRESKRPLEPLVWRFPSN